MIKQITAIVLFFLLFSFAHSQVWQQMASVPSSSGLDAPIYFTIGSKVYVGGGWDGGTALNSFYQYTPAYNTWAGKSNLPGGIYSAGCFDLNGKGYVVCGATPSLTTTVYQYDPDLDVWTVRSNFPGSARQNFVGFSANGKGYVFSGFGSNSNDLWQYNDTTDTWSQMATCPGPQRDGPTALVIDNEIFVGMGGNSSGTVLYSDFYKYSPATNTYTQVANIPVEREGPANFTIGNLGYIGLGHGTTGDLSDFYTYAPSSNAWTRINDFGRASGGNLFSVAVDGKPYVGCGLTANGSLHDNWSFEFAMGIEPIANGEGLVCYPSPSNGKFTIDMTSMGALQKQVTIYNNLGQKVFTEVVSEKKLDINLKLAAGIYQIAVTSGNTTLGKRVEIE